MLRVTKYVILLAAWGAICLLGCGKEPTGTDGKGRIVIDILWGEEHQGRSGPPPEVVKVRLTIEPGPIVQTFDPNLVRIEVSGVSPGTYSAMIKGIDDQNMAIYGGSAHGIEVVAAKSRLVLVTMITETDTTDVKPDTTGVDTTQAVEPDTTQVERPTLDVSRLWGHWQLSSSLYNDRDCGRGWTLTLNWDGTASSTFQEIGSRCRYYPSDFIKQGDEVQILPGGYIVTRRGTYVVRGDTLVFDFDLPGWGTRFFVVRRITDTTMAFEGGGVDWYLHQRLLPPPPPATSDGFVYYAPQVLAPPVIDGDPGDWPSDDELPWEPINHWREGSGQESWGWNAHPKSPEDLTAEFKMMWGYVGPDRDVPVLYVLVHWMDDEFHFRPPEEGGKWDNADVFQFGICETCVRDGISQERVLQGWYIDKGIKPLGIDRFRQSNVFLGEEVVRIVNQAEYNSHRTYPIAPGPYTQVRVVRASQTEVYIEEQWPLYEIYPDQYLEILPGETILPLTISGVNDYDSYDGSFSYVTWGLSNRGLNDSIFSEVVLMPPLR